MLGGPPAYPTIRCTKNTRGAPVLSIEREVLAASTASVWAHASQDNAEPCVPGLDTRWPDSDGNCSLATPKRVVPTNAKFQVRRLCCTSHSSACSEHRGSIGMPQLSPAPKMCLAHELPSHRLPTRVPRARPKTCLRAWSPSTLPVRWTVLRQSASACPCSSPRLLRCST
jgi:hypothetical protein